MKVLNHLILNLYHYIRLTFTKKNNNFLFNWQSCVEVPFLKDTGFWSPKERKELKLRGDRANAYEHSAAAPCPINKVRTGKCAQENRKKVHKWLLLKKSLLGRKNRLALLTKCHFSDETRNWGPDPLWSLIINQNKGVGVRFPGPITKRSKIKCNWQKLKFLGN